MNKAPCDPKLSSLKSLFLGPQSENSEWLEKAWLRVLHHWVDWRRSLFPADGKAVTEADQGSPLFRARQREMDARLGELLAALERESPKFTPRFLGHMVSELSLPGVLGHVAALLHNPNQTSREVSLVTSALETEAIADLAAMTGLPPGARGHFTSGGTVANLEVVWRAIHRLDRTLALALFLRARGALPRGAFAGTPCYGWSWLESAAKNLRVADEELAATSLVRLGQAEFADVYRSITGERFRSPLLLAPDSRHYSWPKAMALTGLGQDSLREIPLDGSGRISLGALEAALARAREEKRGVLMVVSVAGATGTGAVDPIGRVQDILERHKAETGEEIWHHVDAAYGGYFCTLLRGDAGRALAEEPRLALQAVARAHSLTLDPHKLGFVPYSCGAFLARDELHYRAPSFAAPYLLADNAGAWMHTIEGSRPATGVAATWLSNRCIGLNADGYGRVLSLGLAAARELAELLRPLRDDFVVLEPLDLNIVNIALSRPGEALSQSNERTLACFERFRRSPNFAVSKTELSCTMYRELLARTLGPRHVVMDAPALACLRLVLMNPFLTTQETKVPYLTAFVEELRRHARDVGL